MAAVALPETALMPYVAAEGRVSIAALNSPTKTVVSGDAEAIERLSEALRADGVEVMSLKVSHAFHSHRLEPMLRDLESAARDISFQAPRIPIVSNLTGVPLTLAELSDPQYWARHARQPVRFHAGLSYALARGHRVFVECGPSGTLCGFGTEATSDIDMTAAFVPTLKRDRDAGYTLAAASAGLYVNGFFFVWAARDAERPLERARIPSYAFQRESLWVPLERAETAAATPSRTAEAHPLLGMRLKSPDAAWQWERVLARDTIEFLADHVVDGRVIVPATAYIEIAFAAAEAGPRWPEPQITDLVIHRPLVLESAPRAVQVRVLAAAAHT
jgi:acyl transferase domain-containing protein